MNRLLPGVMRPFSDEVLSSWLHRGLQRNKDRRFDELLSLYHEEKVLDPDHEDSIVALQLLEQTFKQPKSHVLSMLPATDYWVMPIKHRRFFCSECVIEDVRRGYIPVYRKSWIYRWSIICPVHTTILSSTEIITTNSNTTMQLALHALAKNEFSSSWRVKPSISASKYSTHAGFLNIAYYFQEWLLRQSRKRCICMPGGQLVDSASFFSMIDTISLSMMRPVAVDEKRISQAYSYLPPRKWPTQEIMGNSAEPITNRDIGSLDPIEKAGLFSYFGLLVGVPKCCRLWRILGRCSAHYCRPDSRSLFPDDDRKLREKILERLGKEKNPLLDTVEVWFNINLRVCRGII
ncbi:MULTISPECIES: TniQ family protein [Pseudomonas]|uniref:TniQ family protein n=1 Tax=Pseudomonas TaxID=286 RepID=UPI0009BA72BD|nr:MULTISPECIES: TniQ family protein [Pseudomonas]